MSTKAASRVDQKSRKVSVSFQHDLFAHAESAAAKSHGGNLSRYLASLIERDLQSGKGPTLEERIAALEAKIGGGK